MEFSAHFNTQWSNLLWRQPLRPLLGHYQGIDYRAHIALPDYGERLLQHYADILHGDLAAYSQRVDIPFLYQHYGVIIEFEKPALVTLHDTSMQLESGLRQIMQRLGPIIFKNAYLDTHLRSQGHRNRFPHLNFHIDRSINQPTQYSMYTRDPFDDEQRYPRTASTLFIPSLVGNLQAVREGQPGATSMKGGQNTYTLFTREDMSGLLGNIILQHAWSEPVGIGEVSMLDNRTTLHCSYYRDPSVPGYKIGVRYLA